MTLTPDDIKHIKKIGDSEKGEILHVTTKGGFHMVVERTKGGALNVLGQGSHKSFAIHQTRQVHKNINWDEALNKSEDLQNSDSIIEVKLKKQDQYDAMGNPIYESTPQNHYDLASHHSKMAGKARELERAHKAAKPFQWSPELHDHQMQQLMHSDIAIKNYMMSGLSRADANKEHEKHMQLHNEIADDAQAPFSDHALGLAWNRANPTKRQPSGLGHSWSE